MRLLSITSLSTLSTVLFMTPFATAQPRDWGPYPMGWHYMWGGIGIGMFFFMIVFWIALIAGVVALVRWLWTGASVGSKSASPDNDAEAILRIRFAKGEINEEEYRNKLQTLRTP